jgi:hypothetical protein
MIIDHNETAVSGDFDPVTSEVNDNLSSCYIAKDTGIEHTHKICAGNIGCVTRTKGLDGLSLVGIVGVIDGYSACAQHARQYHA